MRALLDINVLIALLDPDHLAHHHAWSWLRSHVESGWASCPITQNGCVRIMSQPAYPNPLPPAAVIERLVSAVRHPLHEFWPDGVSLLEPTKVDASRVHGPKQVTDVYLLALAVEHGGRFVTFDRAVPREAVPGARPGHLCVL